MNWAAEVTKVIESRFKEIGINYKPSSNVQRCLIEFMNLEMKLIKSVPRTIFKSKELRNRLIPLKYIKSLNYIEKKIKTGIDITYHQSKRILDPLYNDLLINEWVIQHIHLSDTKAQKGQKFYDRSKYLLFAAFNNSQAFFIDVREHGEQNVFAKREFLEIIDNNWPQLIRQHTSEDAVLFSNKYSDAEIELLRKKGYSLGTTIVNGKVIINPGLGITTSGHNLHVVKRANEVIRYLSEIMEEINKDEESIKMFLGKETGLEINELNLCIHRLEKWPFFAVFENTSKCYLEKNYSQNTAQ